jgi:hypothetical protein
MMRELFFAGDVRLLCRSSQAALGAPDAARPLHWNDLEEFIQPKVESLLADVAARGTTFAALARCGARCTSLQIAPESSGLKQKGIVMKLRRTGDFYSRYTG